MQLPSLFACLTHTFDEQWYPVTLPINIQLVLSFLCVMFTKKARQQLSLSVHKGTELIQQLVIFKIIRYTLSTHKFTSLFHKDQLWMQGTTWNWWKLGSLREEISMCITRQLDWYISVNALGQSHSQSHNTYSWWYSYLQNYENNNTQTSFILSWHMRWGIITWNFTRLHLYYAEEMNNFICILNISFTCNHLNHAAVCCQKPTGRPSNSQE